jgi:protein phosphatase
MSTGQLIADSIVSYYDSQLDDMDIDAISFSKSRISLPVLSSTEVLQLCDAARCIFGREEISLQLDGHIIIVGDLHGQILDLLRVLQTFGLPRDHKYLFLGDIVDRGEFSIETCALVLSLKVKYPRDVFVIRGNHEFESLCRQCGFLAELTATYGPCARLFDGFLNCFAFMPLTAIIQKKILCVHGGLGPRWISIGQARQLRRPIYQFGDEVLDAMLWSDPDTSIRTFVPSLRGAGYHFGETGLNEFLEFNGLSLLVRAHECVQPGCRFIFKGRMATVFGASNYGGWRGNNSAVLEVRSDGSYEAHHFLPLHHLRRFQAKFGKLENGVVVDAVWAMRPPSMARMPMSGLPPLVTGLPPLIAGLPMSSNDPWAGKAATARAGSPMPIAPPATSSTPRSPRKVW